MAASVAASSIRSATFHGNATAISVTAGDRLVVFVGDANTAPPYATPTDSQANTYTYRTSTGSSGLNSNVYTAVAGSTGTLTVTINDGSSGDSICSVVVAITGADTSQSSFITAVADGESTGPTVNFGARSSASSVLLAFVAVASSSMTVTPGAGWDSSAPGYREAESGSATTGAMTSRVVSDTGDYDPSWTLGASLFWSAVAIEILSASGGGTSSGPYLTTRNLRARAA